MKMELLLEKKKHIFGCTSVYTDRRDRFWWDIYTVARLESYTYSIICTLNLKLYQMDMKSSLLNGYLKK